MRAIARSIGRDVSVVSREITRNRGMDGRYVPVTADVKAAKRRCRRQVRKVDADPVVAERVWADLAKGRSPRQIAGRPHAEKSDPGLPVATPSPPGHLSLTEGDLIIGAAGATAAATLVERTTPFLIILGLPDGKHADGLAGALIDSVTSWLPRSRRP